MNWDVFYPYVLPSVIGCPNPTADLHIRQAAIEFCRRTLCHTVTLDPITADGINTKFELELPSQTQPVKIMAAEVAGKECPVMDTQRGLQLVRQDSVAEFCFTQDKKTLDVHPPRAKGDTIVVDVALMPTPTAKSLDDDVAQAYMQEIAYGALASLQMLPQQTWTDAGMAAANKALFNQRIATIAMHFARGQAAAKLRSFKTYF